MSAERKPHLSCSQLRDLSSCGVRWARVNLDHERSLVGPGAIIGTATHRAAELNLKAKRDLGALMPLEAVQACARDTLVAEWERGVLLVGEDAADPARTRADAIDQAVAFSTLHHQVLAPKIEAVHLERRWRLTLDAYPRDLEGVIDVQEGPAQGHRVRDLKTASKAPPADEADRNLQLTAYSLAVHTLDGVDPSEVCLDYVLTRKKDPVIILTSTRCAEDWHALLDLIGRACRVIESGSFLPAPPGAWWCSESSCSFWNTCIFGRKNRRQA